VPTLVTAPGAGDPLTFAPGASLEGLAGVPSRAPWMPPLAATLLALAVLAFATRSPLQGSRRLVA
jgi:hypothetical protein